MARNPSVRWNEKAGRWMAWVTFPDGSRRKVSRVTKEDARTDLARLLKERDRGDQPDSAQPRSTSFAEVIDAWFADGCPNVAPTRASRHARKKSPNTIANARQLLGNSVIPALGKLKVDQTPTARLEELFNDMAESGYATSTIDRNWGYLHQALQHGLKHRRITTNPAADVLLPEVRPSKPRKSLTIDQARHLLTEAIPDDPRPAMWMTGLMCGLRPGELAGLRWCYVDIDGDQPSIEIAERAHEVGAKYVGQAAPKTERGKRTIGLHPLLVRALHRHREEQRLLGLHDREGFVFCTSNGTPMTRRNLRHAFQRLCKNAGLGENWTTYEMRHSFVSLVSDQIDDLTKVADLAGHVDTRTTQGYRHAVRPSLPHAIGAWDQLLEPDPRSTQPTATPDPTDVESEPTTPATSTPPAAEVASPSTLGEDTRRLVYTLAETAEMLGISRTSAHNMATSGELETITLGKTRFVTRPTIETLLGISLPPS